MRESIRLGTIFGVRIGLNLSVLVILAVLVFGLAAGRFPADFPDLSTGAYIVAAVGAALLFFASLLAHELSHAVVARRNGVDVEGITLWLFGGVARLRGEPDRPGADFRIAIVGPLTSFAVAVASALVALGLNAIGLPEIVVGVFAYLAIVNVLLGVFNLVPAAPLDGGRVLRAALWAWRGDRAQAAVTSARAGRVFGFALMALGFFQVVAGLGIGGLWLVLIGLFLVHAAMVEEQQTRVTETLHGVRVEEVMSGHPVAADPAETLDQFIAGTAWTHRHSTYPLVDHDGKLLGLATLNRIRDVPADRRSATTLRDVACSPDELPLTSPDELLVDLLPRMQGCGDGRAVVLDDGQRVAGIVSPTDISRAIQLHDMRAFGPYRRRSGADLTSARMPRGTA